MIKYGPEETVWRVKQIPFWPHGLPSMDGSDSWAQIWKKSSAMLAETHNPFPKYYREYNMALKLYQWSISVSHTW